MKDDSKCFHCDRLLTRYKPSPFGPELDRVASYVSMYVRLSTGQHSQKIRICLHCFLNDGPPDLVKELTKGIDKNYGQ